MLQDWAAIAQIIGVTMQGIDFAKAVNKSGTKAKPLYFEEMHALVGLKHPLVAWKQLHMGYSALRPGFERIFNELSNDDGTPKRIDEILPRALQNLLSTPVISNALFNINEQIEVAIAELRQIQNVRKVAEENYTVVEQTCKSIPDLAFILRRLNFALDNALKYHDQFVEFGKMARKYVDKDVWGLDDVRFFLNNRLFIYNLVNRMQEQTDAALMTLLEINVAIVNEMEKDFSSK